MFNINKIFKKHITKDEIAKILQVNKELLDVFEKKYEEYTLLPPSLDNPFDINAKQMADMKEKVIIQDEKLEDIKRRIVAELVNQTVVWEFDGKNSKINTLDKLIKEDNLVTKEEIYELPENIRPQLTGRHMQRDINGDSYVVLLDMYQNYKKNINNKVKSQQFYKMFRQGLDILDLDEITYEMLSMNPNNMGYWLPKITDEVVKQDFFMIPKTKIIKVPISVLQLTRMQYEELTATTLNIVDRYCKEVFELNNENKYFIKTGTYSSKFDFRNAYIHDSKEVDEIGEYLLYIQNQACMMAGYTASPSFYGVSTTNEWVVREFIEDKENNPTIYKGLPLHTEYRIFADFDTKEILGMSPYWHSDVMKKRFGSGIDSECPHNVHDYIIYQMHEDILMERYEKNKDMLRNKIEELLYNVTDLGGQWSIDIMQNDSDFYIIDMALAKDSALNNCVPIDKMKKIEENWLPKINT